MAKALLLRRLTAALQQPMVCHGRVAQGQISCRCAVIPHGALSQNQLARGNIMLQCATAANADGTLDTAAMQLLQGDAHGSSANTGGDCQHLHSLIGAADAAELTIISQFRYVFQMPGNMVDTRRISGQQGIGDIQ